MTLDPKLAPVKGNFHRLQTSGLVTAARRAWGLRAERGCTRPLRGIDGWSDQAEIAYLEEHALRRA